MDLLEFKKLAETYKTIPVYKKILADLLTPISTYMRLEKNAEYAFILESVEKGEQYGRYSFIGRNPDEIIKSENMEKYIKEVRLSALEKPGDDDIIDKIYNKAMKNGALGGKLLGAGGGGIIIFYVPESKQESLKKALSSLLYIPLKFDFNGSQIIYKSVHKKYPNEENNRFFQRTIIYKIIY